MQSEDGSSGTATTATSTCTWKLLVTLCLLVPVLYRANNSFTGPGGVLYGIRNSFPAHDISERQLHDMSSYDDECDLHDINEDPLPAVRTEFTGGATIVYGWPSTGGIWVHEDCYGIELDFLGLSRFEPSATERFSAEEDEFCERLEMIGGQYYETEYAYNKEQTARQDLGGVQLWCGWPGEVPGGDVWALWITRSEAAGRGVSRIRNALTMAERCKAIEMLGGRLYEKWEDVAMAKPGRDIEKVEL